MANNETIKAERTTPYGFKLEDGSYRTASEAVRKFVGKKLPAELEIIQQDGKEITKVSVLGSNPEQNNPQKENFQKDIRYLVDAGNIIQRATDLVIAGQFTDIKDASKQVLENFFWVSECLKLEKIID